MEIFKKVNSFIFSHGVIPSEIKEAIGELMTKENYDINDWTVTIKNTGPQEPMSYYHLFCHHCKTVLLPKLFEKYKEGLGPNPDVVTVASNWDALKIADKYLDYVGCFLPWNKTHHAGPNARRYIRDPKDHPKSTHAYTTKEIGKKRPQKQASLSFQPPKKVMSLDKSPPPPNSNQTTIMGKWSKKHKFNRIETFMTDLSLTSECTTPMARFGKGFCLSMVHSGVNKMLSNDAIIENYQTSIAGKPIKT